jgi:hypothetical protein
MFIMVMKQSYIYYFIVTMLNKFGYIIIYLARGLPLLKSVSHMFENWLHNQDDKLKKDNNGVVAVLCWIIWRCWNDIIFNKIKYYLFM